MPESAIPNIVVFGETGGGKTSVINMLDDVDPPLTVDDTAEGTVFTHAARTKTISGQVYRIFDTVGLNRPAQTQKWKPWGHWRDVAKDTKHQLTKIIKNLDPGPNLLVYVMRAPQIPSTAQKNYRIFFGDVCEKQVPIVIIITGLENRGNDMDGWWTENRKAFEGEKMFFRGHACITATKGKLRCGVHINQKLYDASTEEVEKLLFSSCGATGKVDAGEPGATNITNAVLQELGHDLQD
jgi:hypothetical protein